MEPEAWHVGLAACTGEGLAYGIATHWLAVAADEHPVRPGPLAHVGYEDGQHVRRNRDGPFARVGLGWGVKGLSGFEEFDAVGPDGDGTGVQVAGPAAPPLL